MDQRYPIGEGFLRLWLEHAHESLIRMDGRSCRDAVSTFQTEEQFFAVMACCPEGGTGRDEDSATGLSDAAQIAQRAMALLKEGRALNGVAEMLPAVLARDAHIPFSVLQVFGGSEASLLECDAPPLFFVRHGRLVLLPVLEEISHGHLMRKCQFQLQDGDRMAMVSEGFIRAKGWQRRWGWQEIAASVRRLTGIRCDAQELLDALISTYHRIAQGDETRDVSVVTMSVRPLHSVTVWSGPPTDPAMDGVVLDKLMAETGQRIICGDTTASIAARLLEAEVVLEPRPQEGWIEVPPTSRLEGLDLVTEGLVTMRKAAERLTAAQRSHDLPHGADGATRLARMLLAADKIHFLVGLAVNPVQAANAAGTVPLRRLVVEDLIQELEARGKIVSIEYFGIG